jgi:hypothetical protein
MAVSSRRVTTLRTKIKGSKMCGDRKTDSFKMAESIFSPLYSVRKAAPRGPLLIHRYEILSNLKHWCNSVLMYSTMLSQFVLKSEHVNCLLKGK